MRVVWVHPSWRDLVIESLSADPDERRRFLRCCGVDGAALALSEGGGAAGARRRPLLGDDADWDALADGLHHLCGEVDDDGAVRLLDILGAAGADPEVHALARVALARSRTRLAGVDALAAWLALAAEVPEPPEAPPVAAVWIELEPTAAPATPVELERFADWLRLAELLSVRDPELLAKLGFPVRQRAALAAFAADPGPGDEPVLERELRRDALERLAALAPDYVEQARLTAYAIVADAPDPAPMTWTEVVAGGFSVERVLRDLAE